MNAHLPDLPVTLDEDADHFAALAIRRPLRERMRTAFIDRARRTSLWRRRWFQVDEMTLDPAARERLIGKWRASIYNGDLVLNGKSQVLCLSPTSLLNDYRLPPELARGETFHAIVGDLWMSAPRWLDWLRDVGETPPPWLTVAAGDHQTMVLEDAGKSSPAVIVSKLSKPEKPSAPKKTWKVQPGYPLTPTDTAILNAHNEIWPDGQPPRLAKVRDERIKMKVTEKGDHTVSTRAIQRTRTKIHFD